MTRSRTTMLMALLALGTSLASVADLQAGCHGRLRSYFQPRPTYYRSPVYVPRHRIAQPQPLPQFPRATPPDAQ